MIVSSRLFEDILLDSGTKGPAKNAQAYCGCLMQKLRYPDTIRRQRASYEHPQEQLLLHDN